MRKLLSFPLFLFLLSFFWACETKVKTADKAKSVSVADYFNYGDTGVQTAGIKLIPVQTPVGTFKVWTKRFGNNPRIKILLLHGGPATGHEYMECFESFFPKEGFEFYEYDQLGCTFSDHPKDSSLWTTDRYVDEVEQVRKAIGADSTKFFLLGHSWGSFLGMSYALNYPRHVKGLVVANMMANWKEYAAYSQVLAKQMDPKVVAEIRALEARGDFKNPRYTELLMPNFYNRFFCRLQPYPEPLMRSFKNMNEEVYNIMQGPSEFGVGGRLATADVKSRLQEISVPTLMVGARYDTMDPKAMEEQSKMVQHGSYLYCPNGSHMCMWDDQQVFMNGVIKWIREVDAK